MWQRIQTLYLFLAAVACVLPVFFSPSSAVLPHSWSLCVLSLAVSVVSLVNIFLFHNRILQFRINIFSIVLCLGYYGLLAVLTWFAVAQSEQPLNWHPTVWAAMPLVAFILLIMATRAILADEALVRSVNRLR